MLERLCQEYRLDCADRNCFGHFSALTRAWCKCQDPVLRQDLIRKRWEFNRRRRHRRPAVASRAATLAWADVAEIPTVPGVSSWPQRTAFSAHSPPTPNSSAQRPLRYPILDALLLPFGLIHRMCSRELLRPSIGSFGSIRAAPANSGSRRQAGLAHSCSMAYSHHQLPINVSDSVLPFTNAVMFSQPYSISSLAIGRAETRDL